MKVFIMSGISGSGKSTFVNSIVQAHENIEYMTEGTGSWNTSVVSADDYFYDKEGVYRFDVTKLGDAHGACLKAFIEAVQYATPVIIVDNTNTTTEEIAPYYAIAAAYGYEIELVNVTCSPLTASKRNEHGVPFQACAAMAERIRNRRLPPHWSFNPKFSISSVDGE